MTFLFPNGLFIYWIRWLFLYGPSILLVMLRNFLCMLLKVKIINKTHMSVREVFTEILKFKNLCCYVAVLFIRKY